MGRYTCLAVALTFAGCAKGKSADKSPVDPGSSGNTPTLTSPMKDTEPTKIDETAAPAPLPPDDLTPKGGEGGGPPSTESTRPKDAKELGKSSAALGTTDHGELFDQLAVKVESAKLGTKASTELSTAIAGKTTDLDACYANARKTNAKLAGSIELAFSVDAAGNISSVTVKSSTVKSKELETCVKDVTKLVKLDKSLISTKTTKATVVIAFGS
jgi:hypothetical protein